MNAENINSIYKVLLAPMSTEKTTKLADTCSQIAFKVAPWSNKMQIKKAVETLFNVNVRKIATINMRGKTKNFKQRQGKKSNWKKAIISLYKGQDINITEFLKK